MKFKVVVLETHETTYTVNANTSEQAEQWVLSGDEEAILKSEQTSREVVVTEE